ncbi:MAG: hypothetical protein LUH23_03565 [Oscillospiraceae bacterium]|nr:hypothetical protein [Oscillospiraceae bacterium]
MIEKYTYHGMDITMDVYEKIQSVVELIAKKENKSFDECYAMFSKSRTYRNIQLTNTEMWAESAEFIVDEYYREKTVEKN